jgi:hypothetical protein
MLGLGSLTDLTDSQLVIDAADEKAANVFEAPLTGSITDIAFRLRTVTTGATLDIRLEGVDSSGNPSGTLQATNTNASCVVADADDNTWKTVTLTAAASVTQGDELSVVVANPSSSFGNMQISSGVASTVSSERFPYGVHFTSSWAKQSFNIHFAVKYATTGWIDVPGVVPFVRATHTFNSSSNPLKRGIHVSHPTPARVVGWYAILAGTTAATYDVELLSADGSTQHLVKTYDADVIGSNTGGFVYKMFGGSYAITKDIFYKLSFVPNASNLILYEMQASSAALLASLPGGANCYSTRFGSSTWTNDTDRRICAGLIFDQLDDGSGGGGGGLALPVSGRICA